MPMKIHLQDIKFTGVDENNSEITGFITLEKVHIPLVLSLSDAVNLKLLKTGYLEVSDSHYFSNLIISLDFSTKLMEIKAYDISTFEVELSSQFILDLECLIERLILLSPIVTYLNKFMLSRTYTLHCLEDKEVNNLIIGFTTGRGKFNFATLKIHLSKLVEEGKYDTDLVDINLLVQEGMIRNVKFNKGSLF